jgi:WhiB family redox-sensing transcriptional regulator
MTGASHARQPEREPVDSWADLAACRGLLDDTMHPDTRFDLGVARAKAVCAVCPVVSECLEHALANDEDRSVWGGMTPSERSEEASRRMWASRS